MNKIQKTVLVVDDDAAVRSSLRRTLEQSGYSVEVAEDGERGKALLEQRTFDLVLLDLSMPRRDGWDVLEDMEAVGIATPVIVLTGLVDQLADYRVRGASALMQKPVDAQQLLREMQALLEAGRGLHPDTQEPCGTRILLSCHPRTKFEPRIRFLPGFKANKAGAGKALRK